MAWSRNFIDITGQLHIEMSPAQTQKGSVDCGLFAIAYACELANAHLTDVSFNQAAMRTHLVNCFEKGEILSFPRARKPALGLCIKESKQLITETFCTCCLREEGDVVQCELCDHWYHISCTDLSSCPQDDQEWLCRSCAPTSKFCRTL